METMDLETLFRKIPELKKMQEDVQHLRDTREIWEVISRYTHAVDRHDWEMLHNDVYHPDGIAIHDGVVGRLTNLQHTLRKCMSTDSWRMGTLSETTFARLKGTSLIQRRTGFFLDC